MTNGEKIKGLTMKSSHCKKCGTFIGSFGCDELCPTCRRKETYLTKEEVVAMLKEIQLNIEKLDPSGDEWSGSLDACNNIIQEKIDQLKRK